jgi:L-alanine-DL-glutamate epimerase-like enolase superfamily enzyme
MSAIDRIEIHEFTYETPNLGPDSSGFNFVYRPGGKFEITKFALVVRTADGGRGEYVTQWGGTKIALAQVMTLVPQLIGKDASQREFIYDICKRALRQFDHMGYGAIDILLWDWAGKSVKQPISKMLGGWRTKLPTYASTYHGDRNGGLSSPQAYVDFAQQCYDMGYRAFKMHGWTEGNVREEVETVLKLGERFRGKMTLMLDPACELRTFADALTVGRACDEAGSCGTKIRSATRASRFTRIASCASSSKHRCCRPSMSAAWSPRPTLSSATARIMCGPIPSTTSASPAP